MSLRESVFRGIAEDLEVAAESWSILEHLRLVAHHARPLQSIAPSLLWLAMRAFRDSVVIHLWKVYDNSSDVRSLAWFIRHHSVQSPDEAARALKRIEVRGTRIAKLRALRHQVFAHHGKEKAHHGRDALLQLHELSSEDIRALIEDARTLLKSHSGQFLPWRLGVLPGEALEEVIDLDVHLDGYWRGQRGIERVEPDWPSLEAEGAV